MDEPEILDDEEAPAPTDAEEANVFEDRLVSLQARCAEAGIAFEIDSFDLDEFDDKYGVISITSGKNKRRIIVSGKGHAELLLSIPFERYSFISGFDAIFDKSGGYIEAGLRSNRISPQSIVRRIKQLPFGTKPEDVGSLVVAPPDPHSIRPSLEIGPASPEFSALTGNRNSRYSLKLRGARAIQHDQASTELRSYADSLLFQIDAMYGGTLFLDRERRARFSPPMRRGETSTITYPIAQYNEDAISLYWYAKGARDMPLLRFLAFYQSIEFYFPRYSQGEARRRVGAIIKDPTFRSHREDDLDRLISAIKVGRSGAVGSERSQLRAVVSECIGADEARAYLNAHSDRVDHFSSKSQKRKYHLIPLLNKTADLRTDIADRIYDIRCKIVHTKNEHSEDESTMILPFSDDADYLSHDIDLVEFVAKRVLISSSIELY